MFKSYMSYTSIVSYEHLVRLKLLNKYVSISCYFYRMIVELLLCLLIYVKKCATVLSMSCINVLCDMEVIDSNMGLDIADVK